MLPPLGGGHPKPPFEHRVEKSEVSEPAFEGYVHDFRVRIAQKLQRSLQPHFRLLGPQRISEVRAKEPAEVPFTASALVREIGQGLVLNFR